MTDKQILDAFHRKEKEYLDHYSKDKPRIAYLCLRTPVELLQAIDAVPLRIIPLHDYDAAFHTGVRPDGCSFCQNIPAFINTSKYRGIQAVIGGACCDQMRRIMDTLPRQLPLPVILYGAPRTWEMDEGYFLKEMTAAFQRLASIINKSFDTVKIKRKIIARNALREKIKSLRSEGALANSLLNAISASPLPSDEICSFLQAHPRRQRKSHLRLLLAGSIPGWWEVQIIEEIGVEIAADATCLGDRAFYSVVGSEGSLLENLYRAYVAENLCPHRRPVLPTIEYIRNLAAERKVDGIIFLTLKYCHPWGLSALRMKDELKLPFLSLDDDLTSPAVGNFKTRIGAFVEMLQERKFHYSKDNV